MVSAVPFFITHNQGDKLLNDYLKAQSKTNETIIANNFSSDELDRFSKSDYRWADNRTKHFRNPSPQKTKN